MRIFEEFGKWLANNVFGPILGEIFADYLQFLGVSAAITVLAAPLLAFFAGRLLVSLIEPEPDVAWSTLDPDDGDLMRRSFSNMHIATRLAEILKEDISESVEEFTDQVRRLGLYGKHSAWERLDPDNYELVSSLYEKQDIPRHLAEKLGRTPAATPEEFRQQIRDFQSTLNPRQSSAGSSEA